MTYDSTSSGVSERPNMRLSGRAVNKVPGLSRRVASEMMRWRAAQLWR